MDMSQVGKRIKERRTELKLTQTQISKETGISCGNLSDFEHGNKLPSAPSLYLLSQILECSVDWILTGNFLKREELFFTNEKLEQCYLLFNKLTEAEKTEILNLMEFKVFQSTQMGKSLHSGNQNNTIGIA